MASAVGESEAARAPPLHEIHDALKRQLGLEGTFEEVINAACPQLGVPPAGSLHAKGNACWRAMYGVTDYYPDPSRAAAPDAADAGPDADAAATDLRVRVSCPAGASAGDVVTTTLPDGRSIRAPIPAGLAPGEAFTIRVRALPGSTDEEVRNLPVSLENGRRGDVRGGGVARQEMDRGGGYGSMSPDLLNGCWVASVCPIPFIWAIYHNQKVTDDRVRGEQASVGIARRPQRREPFPRRQRLRLLFWLPDPLR